MIGYKERNSVKEALTQMASGTEFKKVNKELSWVPSSIAEDKVDMFVQSVMEAYKSGASEISFDDAKFEVKFVKENKTVSIKPGLYGKTNVLLGEQVYKSFTEVRQAKVFAVQLEHASKNAAKPKFKNTFVESVTEL